MASCDECRKIRVPIMKKILKIIGIVGVLLIALVVAIPFFIDLNDYKPQISDAVHEATGRELDIKGDIDLSLFPWIGLELGAVQLSNAEGFSDAPFAQMERMDIKLKLLPLLSKSVEMKAIVLHDLGLNLEVNKQGVTNWDDLAQSSEEATEEPKAEESSDASGALPLESLSIEGVEFVRARIVYTDHAAGAKYTLNNLSLETGQVVLNEPLDLTFNTDFESSQPEVRGHLSLTSHIVYNLESQQHRLEKTAIKLTFDSKEFSSKGQANLDFDALLDLAAQQYNLSGVTLRVEIDNPDMPEGKVVADLSAEIAANLESQIATLSDIKLESYGLNLSGDVKAQTIIDAPKFQAEFNLAEFNPRDIMQKFSIEVPEMADATVLTKADLNLKLKGSTEFIDVTQLNVNFDDTALTGKVEVQNFEKPAITYNFHITGIDADRYLPPPSDVVEETVPVTTETAEPELPLDTLRDLNIDGQFTMGNLKVSNMKVKDIRADLKAQNGTLRLYPLGMKLYEGEYKGDITLDVTKDIPVISLNEKVSGVQAGTLLKDLMDDDFISGTANLQAKVTAQGLTPEKIMETLNGDAIFLFSDGAVKGLNLAHMLRKAKAKLKGQTLPDTDVKKTDFAKLGGSFLIKNGVVSNNDLEATLPFSRVTGEGTVDLPRERLNYLVQAKIVNTSKGQGGAELSDLKGLTVPVRIKGSFSDPSIKLDMDKLIGDKAKAKLNEKKAELKAKAGEAKAKLKAEADAKKAEAEQKLQEETEALKEKAADEVKDKLKSLFN